MKQAGGPVEMEGEVEFRIDTQSNQTKAVSGTDWMYQRGALERGKQVGSVQACERAGGHACGWACRHACMRAGRWACVQVCMCVCTYVHVCQCVVINNGLLTRVGHPCHSTCAGCW